MKLTTYIQEVYTISFWQNGGKALCSELSEVVEAVSYQDWPNAWYETSQVLLYLVILSHYALDKFFGYELVYDIPSCLPWKEDYDRIVIWKQILLLAQIEQKLDPEWFNQGNNWKKPVKVQYVLSQAGKNISLEEAQALIDLVSE